ncbi:GntR family transcriptional regulator [Actinoalloteichus sp. AHMU CJ021]|uniref:GntR family transcriptional regulator n=1 Tax=Actinoalloteichus sp. AHMU CJ021 TaxID=2072503 RepID=UPI000CA03501|nr:GntR family transcriptional regulator [Actinoalloteichus sp. AHMU CJ021]
MILEIDPKAPVPPYEQVRAQLATVIDTGALPAGSRLPSIRQLAQDLGIATGTVARAYRELEGAGYLSSRVGRGTVVLDRPQLGEEEREELVRAAARDLVAAARRWGVPPDRVRAVLDEELDRH